MGIFTSTWNYLQTWMDEEEFSGQEVDSIYYATQNFRMPYLVRVRTYRREGVKDETFLEIKYTEEGLDKKERAKLAEYQHG